MNQKWIKKQTFAILAVMYTWNYLDVVQVDLSQRAVIVEDSLEGLLHIRGVWRFFREALEWIWFHNTWMQQEDTSEAKEMQSEMNLDYTTLFN